MALTFLQTGFGMEKRVTLYLPQKMLGRVSCGGLGHPENICLKPHALMQFKILLV